MTPFVQQDIESDEGFSVTAYPDPLTHAAPWTVGYGSTGKDVHKGTVWTQPYAALRCEQSIEHTYDALRYDLPWYCDLSDPRQDVLVNMAYNMGVEGLLAFHNTLAAIGAGRYVEGAADMLQSKWAKQVPNRAKRLAEQMKTGVRA